jgi:subtilisin family serine protease
MYRFQMPTGIVLAALICAASARADQPIGINVLLNMPPSGAVLDSLRNYGQVLDVIPEINAVTMRAKASQIPAIRALAHVITADADVQCEPTGGGDLPVPDLSGGADIWNLDAINVTDFGGGRTVAYDGAGVYVAVLDSGLPHNWRSYFPAQRIATHFAVAFTGGGGVAHTISSQPNKWEHDTGGHGTTLVSVILGFAYSGPDPLLPAYFNGVAPKATIIPVRVGGLGGNQSDNSGRWVSLLAHSIVYVTNLKVSGALASAPLVINLSTGEPRGLPLPIVRAAIDYAIDNGVIVVAAAGNEADGGMRYPAAYPEVISVAATGWIGQFPADDPTIYRWMLRDVPESEASLHFVAPFSSRELPGQELDIAAPGFPIPTAMTVNGTADYTFTGGTSQATSHVVGVAALMLQKNPTLTQAQIESILKGTTMPLPVGCATVRWVGVGPGNPPTWRDHNNLYFFDLETCWGANATGAGLLQAEAALAATPLP